MSIDCSVIVSTRNRPKKLLNCLRSLTKQTVPPKEVIIVDDASDYTIYTELLVTAQTVVNSVFILTFVRNNKKGGPSFARNRGIDAATTELVFFTDDDCIVPPDWCERHIKYHVRYPDATAVHGWYEPLTKDYPGSAFDDYELGVAKNTCPDFLEAEIYGDSQNVPQICTSNVSVKRSLLKKFQLQFDENITFPASEDLEFTLAVSQKGLMRLHVPMVVYHDNEWNWSSFLRTNYNRGIGFNYCQLKYSLGRRRYTLLGLLRTIVQPAFVLRGLEKNKYLAQYTCYLLAKWRNSLVGFKPEIRTWFNQKRSFISWMKSGKEIRRTIWVNNFAWLRNYLSYDHRINFITTSLGDVKQCSVVIPIFNRSQQLALLLERLVRQTVNKEFYEIIVVDDGSSENILKVIKDVQNLNSSRPKIKYVRQNNSGAAVARNTGVKNSSGEIILFIDSDVVPDEFWIESHLQVHAQFPEVSSVVGGQWVSEKVASIFDKNRNNYSYNKFTKIYSTSLIITNNLFVDIGAFDTANMSIKKNIFLLLGGLDPDQIRHHDVEFAFRLQSAGMLAALAPIVVTTSRSMNVVDFFEVAKLQGQHYPRLYQKILSHSHLPSMLEETKNFYECPAPQAAWYLLGRIIYYKKFALLYACRLLVVRIYYRHYQKRLRKLD
jgi:glycosyltransferase involved in cell wall biosynthesis